MKLTKVKLIKLVKPGLKDLGFTEFKNSKNGWQGFFCKKLKNDYYLTLGLSIHRYYECAFTADYYLSKTTLIGATWGDIPDESYKRPSFLLTNTERSIYPTNEINVKGTYDIWWDGKDEKSVLDFLRVIKLTEPRFINQSELLQKIEQSQDVQKLYNYSEAVKKITSTSQINGAFSFIPAKEIDGIPIIWFKAAEKVLKDNKETLNAHTVYRLAADAFRQKKLTNDQQSICDAYEPLKESFNPNNITKTVNWLSQLGSAFNFKRDITYFKCKGVIENHRFDPVQEDRKATTLIKPIIPEPKLLGEIRIWFDKRDLFKHKKENQFVEEILHEVDKIVKISKYKFEES